MFYTPKYCCECGEKIEQKKRKLLVVKGFCETCESEFKFHEWMARGLVGAGILGLIFGIGSFLKKSDAPLNVSTTRTETVASNKIQNARNVQALANTSLQTTQSRSPENAVGNFQSNSQTLAADLNQQKSATQVKQLPLASSQNSASEIVYFCGAQTKKGTPCLRRVKIKNGRCWQHTGQPAMLPPEKLVASR